MSKYLSKFSIVVLTIVVPAIVVPLAACESQLTQLAERPETSFGQDAFALFCQRLAYQESLALHREDTQRPIDVSGSRYGQACRLGAAYLPDEKTADGESVSKVQSLFKHRTDLIEAIDHVLPADQISVLDATMRRILPAVDDGMVSRGLAWLSTALDRAAANNSLLEESVSEQGRKGYLAFDAGAGLLSEILNYPKLRKFGSQLLAFVDTGGSAHAYQGEILDALSFELGVDSTATDPATRPGNTVNVDDEPQVVRLHPHYPLLFAERPDFSRGGPLWIVRRDKRGIALPAGATASAPFIDNDGDGYADTTASGQIIGASAQLPAPFPLPWLKDPPTANRNIWGLAVKADSNPIYQYLNLDSTLFAAVSNDLAALFDKTEPVFFDLLVGMKAILGPVVPADSAGTTKPLRRYAVETSPAHQALHASLSLFRGPQIDEFLEALEILFTKHEDKVARLVAAVLAAKDLGKSYPLAKLTDRNNFYDDLIGVLRAMLKKKGLMSDLYKALNTTEATHLGAIIANFAEYRDIHRLNSQTMDIEGATFFVPVDRKQKDTDFNRSMLQRMLHAIHGSHGSRYCNKPGATIEIPLLGIPLTQPIAECDLVELKNSGIFFIEAISWARDASGHLIKGTPAAHFRLKTENLPFLLAAAIDLVGENAILKALAPIDGIGSHPTPQGLSRLLFANPLPSSLQTVFSPAISVDGRAFNKDHLGSVLAWEAVNPGLECSSAAPCNFYDAFRPFIQAFHDNKADALLLDMLRVFHFHFSSSQSGNYQYTSPSAPDFSWGSNLQSYEPLIAAVLRDTDLWPALRAFTSIFHTEKIASGKLMRDVLVDSTRYLLEPEQAPELSYPDGSKASYSNDGKRIIPGGVSPFYLLADSLNALDRARAQRPTQEQEGWLSTRSILVDLFFSVESLSDDSHRFANRHTAAALPILLSHLRTKISEHQLKGDLHPWLAQELPQSAVDTLTTPLLPPLLDIALLMTPELRAETKEAAAYLLTDSSRRGRILQHAADLIQLWDRDLDLEPFKYLAGQTLKEPFVQHGELVQLLRFLLNADHDGALVSMAAKLVSAWKNKRAPAAIFATTLMDVHRLRPLPQSTSDYFADDYGETFKQSSDFLMAPDTGFEKLLQMVRKRCGEGCTGDAVVGEPAGTN
jgi:hypothetical protein